jgi:hypothetical protein
MANLANPTVIVNNTVIEIRPGTLRFKGGAGDLTTRTQQSGEQVTTVNNVNAETKIGMVAFEMNTTAANLALKDSWLAARRSGGVTIEFFDEDNQYSFSGMHISVDPENSTGPEGIIPLEFNGNPIA